MTVDTSHTDPATAEADPADVDPDTTDVDPDTTDDEPEVDADAAADDAKDYEQVGREAARYRHRLRAAEAANEALVTQHTAALASAEAAHTATTNTLTRQRQAILDTTLERAGLDPRLATAAGITADSVLTEDGLIDGAKLAVAVKAAVAEFGVQPRSKGPNPNRQQGAPSSGKSETTWSQVLGGRR